VKCAASLAGEENRPALRGNPSALPLFQMALAKPVRAVRANASFHFASVVLASESALRVMGGVAAHSLPCRVYSLITNTILGPVNLLRKWLESYWWELSGVASEN
jgi:hypothetical protein